MSLLGNAKAIARFMTRVHKTRSCWIWEGYSKNGRYGSIQINNKVMQAHRASYELFVGPIPDGLVVMHKCDNTKCVKPKHLKVGTLSDNTLDCLKKGRFRKPKRYKLKGENVIQFIYQQLDDKVPQRKIASKVGVTQSMICVINRELKQLRKCSNLKKT